MNKLGPYEVHPAAAAFPLIEGEEFEELVRDIKKSGLREPIVLTHDQTKLVDGRNRYRACEVAGVDMVFRQLGSHYTEPMVLDFIVSANLARRHLNPGQLAMVGADLEPIYAAAIKAEESSRKSTSLNVVGPIEESQVTAPDREQSPAADRNKRSAAAKAAKAVGASRTTTAKAKAVQRDAPDLAAEVRQGKLSLDAADKERKQRVKNDPKPEQQVKPGLATLTLYTHEGKPVDYPSPKSKSTFNEQKGMGISWAAWSWNPVTGCLHGCEYCYARETATKDSYAPWFPVGFTPLFHSERLSGPSNTVIPALHRDRPCSTCPPPSNSPCRYHRVFVCSMADLYGRWVPDEWIAQVHASMLASPQWEYLLLTKFPSRYVGLELPPSAWVGTSVDEQKRVRIAEDAFRKIDGVKVKWLSLEPLREPLEFSDLSMFDWVVIGAQTETRQPTGVVKGFAPPFDWVARLVTQARESGCRVHLKPNLLNLLDGNQRFVPGMQLPDEYPEG